MWLSAWPTARSGACSQSDWAAVLPDHNQLRGLERPPPIGCVQRISSQAILWGLYRGRLGSLCHTTHGSLPEASTGLQLWQWAVLSREAHRIPGLWPGRVGLLFFCFSGPASYAYSAFVLPCNLLLQRSSIRTPYSDGR